MLKHLYPPDTSMHISHEAIYNAACTQLRVELRIQVIAGLRHGRATRTPRKRGIDQRGQTPTLVSIHVRPPEVNERVMPGYWEGDFIRRAGEKSWAGVRIQGSSRRALLNTTNDARAAAALAGSSAKRNSIAAAMRPSLTHDLGQEMSRHSDLNAQKAVKVWFCDPYSPWQRGTCENTKELLWRHLPKGTDLPAHTPHEPDANADSLNSRPRAPHGFHSLSSGGVWSNDQRNSSALNVESTTQRLRLELETAPTKLR